MLNLCLKELVFSVINTIIQEMNDSAIQKMSRVFSSFVVQLSKKGLLVQCSASSLLIGILCCHLRCSGNSDSQLAQSSDASELLVAPD